MDWVSRDLTAVDNNKKVVYVETFDGENTVYKFNKETKNIEENYIGGEYAKPHLKHLKTYNTEYLQELLDNGELTNYLAEFEENINVRVADMYAIKEAVSPDYQQAQADGDFVSATKLANMIMLEGKEFAVREWVRPTPGTVENV
jgi:hypothetical protein